jgi:hypothetical protein
MSHFDKPSFVLPLDNSTKRRVKMDPDPGRAASGHVQRFERSISIPVSLQHLPLDRRRVPIAHFQGTRCQNDNHRCLRSKPHAKGIGGPHMKRPACFEKPPHRFPMIV